MSVTLQSYNVYGKVNTERNNNDSNNNNNSKQTKTENKKKSPGKGLDSGRS